MAEISLRAFGEVRLEDFMGSDLSVVNAARVSFAKRSESLEAAERGLIHFLMKGRHGTPFENGGVFRFFIECPILVAREWMRHRIGSFNEMSARYTKLYPKFYTPKQAYGQVGKPGAYTFEPLGDDITADMYHAMAEAYDSAWTNYEKMLEAGIAKEIARAVLPVGIYTQFIWTVNARSLMNFLSLRNADTAQQAIREYAEQIERSFAEKMPETRDAFIANGRIAP